MSNTRGREFWRRHLEAWQLSDVTQAVYCVSHGLSTKSFYRWRRKQRELASATKSSLTLVPVSVGAPTTHGLVRLHSPGGWRIELPVGEVAWLADLLRQLP